MQFYKIFVPESDLTPRYETTKRDAVRAAKASFPAYLREAQIDLIEIEMSKDDALALLRGDAAPTTVVLETYFLSPRGGLRKME